MRSLRRTLRRSLRKNLDEGRALVSGQMPAFVTRPRPEEIERIPAFTFHDVEPASFERQLEHLAAGGYRPVAADELAEGGPAERRVALTFDDATWTFWAYAFPLLGRFRFQAVLFVVPGVVPEAAGVRPTLEDVWSGRASRGDVERAGRASEFCTWPEIERMHASGLVDVQSHSLSHVRIPTGPRVIDFLHPDFERAVGGFEIPQSALDRDVPPERPLRLGAPVFVSRPRLAGDRRFREAPSVVQELVTHVADRGGPAYFDQPRWRTSLRRVLDRVPDGDLGAYETAADREAALRRELVESKRLIEDRLGTVVRHLAYPWHAGSDLGDRLARDAGYRSVLYGSFLVGSPPAADGPLRLRRLPERYLLRLPGRGRATLAEAFLRGRRAERRGPP